MRGNETDESSRKGMQMCLMRMLLYITLNFGAWTVIHRKQNLSPLATIERCERTTCILDDNYPQGTSPAARDHAHIAMTVNT